MNNPDDDLFEDEEELLPNPDDVIEIKEETKKVEEPKKSKGINIDIKDANDFILELQFATQMINQASAELKKFEVLGQITQELEKVKNLKIDTSSIEKSLDEELKKIVAKTSEIAEKMDLSELDGIDSKIQKMAKDFKSYSKIQTFLLVLLAFSIGVLCSYSVDSLKSKYKESNEIVQRLKAKGFIFGRDNEFDTIITPTDLKIKQLENQKQYLIWK